MRGINKITTLILLLVWLLVMWRTFWGPPKEILSVVEIDGEEGPSSKEPVEQFEDAKTYASIIERLKAPFNINRYKELFTKNIFIRPEKPTPVFTPENLKLVSTEPIILPFIYNGYIETEKADIIAQVNWAEKTHFVKKGERFRDYKVIEILKKTLIAEGKEGRLVLEFKKPVRGKELVAVLYDELDEKTYTVRKEEEINNYKILDIKANSVVLWGENKEWVIKRER